MAALAKKGAASPANSKREPPIRGPGTVAMLATEFATPKVPPCSFAGVILEMKLGTTVRIIPLPEAIIVNEKMKIAMFGIRGIRNIPNISNRGPNAMSFSSPNFLVSLPITTPCKMIWMVPIYMKK